MRLNQILAGGAVAVFLVLGAIGFSPKANAWGWIPPGAFPVEGYVAIHPYQVSVTVYNGFNAPVACVGRIDAVRADGVPLFLEFQFPFIPLWQNRFAYLTPGWGPVIVNATAFVQCWYL